MVTQHSQSFGNTSRSAIPSLAQACDAGFSTWPLAKRPSPACYTKSAKVRFMGINVSVLRIGNSNQKISELFQNKSSNLSSCCAVIVCRCLIRLVVVVVILINRSYE